MLKLFQKLFFRLKKDQNGSVILIWSTFQSDRRLNLANSEIFRNPQ